MDRRRRDLRMLHMYHDYVIPSSAWHPPARKSGASKEKHCLVWLGRNAGQNFRKPDFATTRKDVPPPFPHQSMGGG